MFKDCHLFLFLSDIQSHQFNIQVNVNLSENTEYRLIYIDEHNTERETNGTFIAPSCRGELAHSSLQSSGSFEAVSDDDDSFTVIQAEDMRISRGWEMTPSANNYSSSTSSNADTSSDNDDDDLMIEKQKSDTVTITDPSNDKNPVQEPFGAHALKPDTFPKRDIKSSKDILLEMDKEESVACKEASMSKSVVFGDDHFSQLEVKFRNRSHLKKINKLSELLDNEKKVSAELLETVMTKTEENMKLHEAMEALKQELHSTQKKLKRATKDSSNKDLTIAQLRESNKSLQERIDSNRKPHGQLVLPILSRFSSSEKYKPSDSKKDTDRSCDIGISRPKKHHHSSRDERQKREHKHRDHQTRSRRSPGHHDTKHPAGNPVVTISAGDPDGVQCPICGMEMPPTLSEHQRTTHVEMCLHKIKA